MASIEVSTDEYRKSAGEFFRALKDETTTLEQADNGFKCLGLMYFGLKDDEFENEMLQQIKTNESVQILKMASNQLTEWKLEHNHPLT